MLRVYIQAWVLQHECTGRRFPCAGRALVAISWLRGADDREPRPREVGGVY